MARGACWAARRATWQQAQPSIGTVTALTRMKPATGTSPVTCITSRAEESMTMAAARTATTLRTGTKRRLPIHMFRRRPRGGGQGAVGRRTAAGR